MADTRVGEKRGVPNSRNTRAEDYYTRDVIRATEAQTVSVSNKDNISGVHSKVISKQTWEFLVDKTSGYEPIFPYRPSLRSEVLFSSDECRGGSGESDQIDKWCSVVTTGTQPTPTKEQPITDRNTDHKGLVELVA